MRQSLWKDATKLYRYEVDLPFSLAEYKERMDKVKEAMRRENIDVLYCSAPESLFYLTGHQMVWYYRESLSGIAINKDADNFVFFEGNEEELLARQTSIAADYCIYRYGIDDPLKIIVGELKKRGWLKGTIGLEKWSHHPCTAFSQLFQAALEKEGAKVADSSKIVREIRAIKTPQEIAYTRTAAAMADIGIKAGIDCIRSGISELDIRAEVDYALAKAGSENAGLVTMIQSGPGTACIHAPTTRRKIMQGDIVSIDCSGVYNRYHADISRVISVGEPHPDVAKQIDLMVKGWPIIQKAIGPHTPIATVNKAILDYYKKVKLWQHRWWIGGYELGIAFPPDWVGAFFFDPETDPQGRKFEPGLTLVWEADVYLPNNAGLARVIDTWLVTEKETENFTKIPPDLIVV